jgi:hypothetical protein
MPMPLPDYTVPGLLPEGVQPADRAFAFASENMRKYWRDWFSRPQDYRGPFKRAAPERGRKGLVQMHVGDASRAPFIDPEA